MGDDLALLGVFEDREIGTRKVEDETTVFVDEGKLPRQPVRQRMQVEYTANVKPLSQDEQRLVARWTQGDDKEDTTTAPTEPSGRPAGLIARKKARRTIENLLAEETVALKPRFLQTATSAGPVSKHHASADMPMPLPQPPQQAHASAKRKLQSESQAQPAKRAKAEHGPHATEQRPSQLPSGFSPLHCEIQAFAEEALPSKAEMQLPCTLEILGTERTSQSRPLVAVGEEEQEPAVLVMQVEDVTQAVQSAACYLWPKCSTQKFGSQATQLSMPGSDVDLVILNTDYGSSLSATERSEKQICLSRLESLRMRLRKDGILDGSFPVSLISAKVPIIKCKVRPPGSQHSLRADISIGLTASNGVDAAALITRYVQALPPLRPIVLIVKRLLKEQNMHEVSSGGLSSFSLINMVIAHLQAEGYSLSPDGRLASQGVPDIGNLLWGFLMRFGDVFDYCDQAISIQQGGVIRKRAAWRVKFKAWLLAIENPLVPGKEVSGGSYRIREVKATFLQAGMALDRAVHEAKTATSPGNDEQAWAKIQADGQHADHALKSKKFALLSSIINADEALS